LDAQVNPGGGDTKYRFEYGPTAAYGTSVPVPDGDAGSGTVPVALSALVEGLSPGTAYHYRIVASNSVGAATGPDRTFTTQSGETPGLLDGRAWEMVSPSDKHGAALEAIGSVGGDLIQAAAGGGAISYVATGPIDARATGNRSIEYTQVLSTRGPAGWSSQGIATPTEPPVVGLFGATESEYRFFSDDLSVGLVEPAGATPLSSAASERTVYRREANGEYTPIVDAANVRPGAKFAAAGEEIIFEGATPDLSHLVVSSKQALTSGFASGFVANINQNLYEWAGGSLQLASVLPGGKPAAEEGVTAAMGSFRHSLSDDGSRVFWKGAGSTTSEEHLYMRDTRLGRTVQLDAVEEGAQGGGAPAARGPVFQTASRDGSKAFFTDEAQLTMDATAASGKPDLYMCEIVEVGSQPSCRLKDLTVDKNAGESADVAHAVVGASDDGRFVYFAANGVLAPGAESGDCDYTGRVAPGATCSLYVYDTVAGEGRFIATLSQEDSPDIGDSGGGVTEFRRFTARVSPNGRYLAFMSDRSLTGYDNIDAHSGQADEEVFLYDASTGRLVCASCNPTGARPAGMFDSEVFPGTLVDRAGSWPGRWLAASVPGWTIATSGGGAAWHQSRYLSDNGRLFFNAADALVPRDTNGREDVYEYEPGGVGGCSLAAGCVGLMSSGASGEESAFLDASESGSDVFFLTASRLASQDVDGGLDVYDARVCSASSPCLASPSAPTAPCSSGDSCRGAASSQSEAFAAPSSMGVSGAGNLIPPASGSAVTGRHLTRAQKLASALRVCRKRPKRRRAVCKARARRLYGSGATAKRAGVKATKRGNR
jgi:hypothetical protein